MQKNANANDEFNKLIYEKLINCWTASRKLMDYHRLLISFLESNIDSKSHEKMTKALFSFNQYSDGLENVINAFCNEHLELQAQDELRKQVSFSLKSIDEILK